MYIRTYVRPRPTAKLRMCERSNSADLAGFRNRKLFVSGPGNVPNTAGKRPSEEKRRRQQDRDKRARETPDERNRRRVFFSRGPLPKNSCSEAAMAKCAPRGHLRPLT